ncbi:tRNA1(Val) (adenine(37)-N6)-methyltransferase [Clostridium minihomine]|uniref:tRNA1(Val) (adenine(37)-N6)-methyltransferase n=1 Tax=Clostridium minihomine TaxID=2045012 RepID=UPI000C75FA91|nr:tRNA1(Val) (adenine(37)-N6)-methyltransferase [Clostridium minihomine]
MQLEPLSKNQSVFVSDTHRFNTDTILLAHFAAPKKGERCADLGTGCGAIPLIWLARYSPQCICAIEIQKDACELVQHSISHCGVSDRLRVLNLDLRQIKTAQPRDPWLENLDLVSCNPPYKMQGAGIQNPQEGKRLARHEETCTIEDIAQAAAASLRYGGRFCLCQRPERLADVITSLCRNQLEPKRLRFVQARQGKAPGLFLLQARKNGQPGGLVVEPPLILHNEDGSFTREMLDIYGDYKEGHV